MANDYDTVHSQKRNSAIFLIIEISEDFFRGMSINMTINLFKIPDDANPLIFAFNNPSMLSANFNTILPTKPSQITTSAVPARTSLPSTLPIKLSVLSFNSACVCKIGSIPLVSSSPIFNRPIFGCSMP